MITIRVMAWPVRAYFIARGKKATPGKSLPVLSREPIEALQNASLLQQKFAIPTREHPIPADSAHAIT
jgi:hypothetical protein